MLIRRRDAPLPSGCPLERPQQHIGIYFLIYEQIAQLPDVKLSRGGLHGPARAPPVGAPAGTDLARHGKDGDGDAGGKAHQPRSLPLASVWKGSSFCKNTLSFHFTVLCVYNSLRTKRGIHLANTDVPMPF